MEIVKHGHQRLTISDAEVRQIICKAVAEMFGVQVSPTRISYVPGHGISVLFDQTDEKINSSA